MMRSLVCVLLGAVLLVVAGCNDSHPPVFAENATLDEKIEITREHVKCPGMVVGVYRNGSTLVEKAYGLADIDTGETLTLNHHFRIASMTKPVVATALLTMVDEGKLSLDDTIDAYIQGVPNGEQITLRMLVQHMSGLMNYIGVPSVKKAFAAEPQRHWSQQELLDMAYSYRGGVWQKPGHKFSYSNTNYVLLGMVMEKIEGKPLADILAARVMKPLGLKHTQYTTDIAMPKPFAQGYQYGDEDGPIYWRGKGVVPHNVTNTSPSMWHGAGAMVSTLGDVKRLFDAIIAGELLSKSSHAEQMNLIDGDYPMGIDYRYGLGLMSYEGVIGHNGTVPGYQVGASYDLERGITIIVLANTYASPRYEEPANAIFYITMKHLTGQSFAPPTWSGW